MTSMPASRSALAMIFAPRSCPSNPGLAITTRIRPPGTWAEYRGALVRHRLLAGVAEPRERARRVARCRRHRDLPLVPRPPGRSRALRLGDLLPRVETRDSETGALGAAGR